MDDAALLAEIRALADDPPNFDAFTAGSRLHHEWLGKVYALLSLWDPVQVPSQTQIEFLVSPLYRSDAVNKIMRALYRAMGDLQFRSHSAPSRAFGPGAVYDFFKNLRDLLASATKSILVVDPYLDEEVFDAYLGAVPPQVVVRLLTNKGSAALKPAVERFVAQSRMTVETLRSNAIHDRVIFLDDRSCWVLGQSINVAAKSKPTYLAPLDNDTMHLKRIGTNRSGLLQGRSSSTLPPYHFIQPRQRIRIFADEPNESGRLRIRYPPTSVARYTQFSRCQKLSLLLIWSA